MVNPTMPVLLSKRMESINVHTEWRFHADAVVEMTITWGWVRKTPVHVLTQEELDRRPDVFRCYVCNENKPISEFGGELARERVCKGCVQYVDDWDVGVIINLDRHRKEKKAREKR
jgi:hypothetical protein